MTRTETIQSAKIQDALNHGDFPEWVLRREVQLIEDAAGDPAAQVTVVVREGNDSVFHDGRLLNRVRDLVHSIFDGIEVDRWPYVRFVSEAEA